MFKLSIHQLFPTLEDGLYQHIQHPRPPTPYHLGPLLRRQGGKVSFLSTDLELLLGLVQIIELRRLEVDLPQVYWILTRP